MNSETITGIIDIGSNTVRLSVYRSDSSTGAYRVVDQGRWAARLSKRLKPDGSLEEEAVEELGQVLLHYRRICRIHGAERIRAVATAALRAAANREEVVRRLAVTTGLTIELLPGREEARLGSLAMLRTLNVRDGFVVDIGGGSTEITLLLDGRIREAVSFPIGCVNMAARFEMGEEPVPSAALTGLQDEARRLFRKEPWIAKHPGLPLIGLGGTVRALAKLRQRETEYPMPLLHGYEQSMAELSGSLERLAALPAANRKKLPGLSKDRADVIVPGLAILRAVMTHTAADKTVVCGVGLRDGLFFETCLPGMEQPTEREVLEESVRRLNALYPTAPPPHLEQVRKLALAVYDLFAEQWDFPARSRVWLETAARLYKIGAAIDLNDNADHTFYLLMHIPPNGLTHREIVLTAAIASFRGLGALRRRMSPYRSMLREADYDAVAKLGSLLQLAAALDRSEAQAIRALRPAMKRGKLILTAESDHPLPVERMEVDSLAKEFKKTWGFTPVLAED